MKQNKFLLIKSIIYRPYSEFITFFIAWIITGQLKISVAIGMADFIVKIFSYFLFDLFWKKVTNTQYKPSVIWLTGLSGSGKTTIANELYIKLQKKDVKCIILDGDEIRSCFPNIGFDKDSRIQHNLNVGYMASLLEKQGYIVIVSLISPFKEGRDKCRIIVNNFIEIYIDTPLAICEKRDVKGLYLKARTREIKMFTGIDSPYEPPLNPELHIKTSDCNLYKCVEIILNKIK